MDSYNLCAEARQIKSQCEYEYTSAEAAGCEEQVTTMHHSIRSKAAFAFELDANLLTTVFLVGGIL